MLAAATAAGVDMSLPDEAAAMRPKAATESRPWLVIVDSGGRLTRFAWLRAQPHWRDVLVLCSRATAPEHIERLRGAHIEHQIVGGKRVDLEAALQLLAERYR